MQLQSLPDTIAKLELVGHLDRSNAIMETWQ